MKYFSWDPAKNEKLKAERGISFEEVVFHVERGDVFDILEHPNERKYGGQRIFVMRIADYVVRGDRGRGVSENHHPEPQGNSEVPRKQGAQGWLS